MNSASKYLLEASSAFLFLGCLRSPGTAENYQHQLSTNCDHELALDRSRLRRAKRKNILKEQPINICGEAGNQSPSEIQFTRPAPGKYKCPFELKDVNKEISCSVKFVPSGPEKISRLFCNAASEIEDGDHYSGNCEMCHQSLKYRLKGTTEISRLTSCPHVFHTKCIQQALEKSVSGPVKCPECDTIYSDGLGHGPMPKGWMKIDCQKAKIEVKKEEEIKVPTEFIQIAYVFDGGVQAPYHKNPGKEFRYKVKIDRVPNTENGRRLAFLLYVAFLQGKLCTISDTRTSRLKYPTAPYYIGPLRFVYYPRAWGKNKDEVINEMLQELKNEGLTMNLLDEACESHSS